MAIARSVSGPVLRPATAIALVPMVWFSGCAHGGRVEGTELASIVSVIESDARSRWKDQGADPARLIIKDVVCSRDAEFYDCSYRAVYTNSDGPQVFPRFKMHFRRHPDGEIEEVIVTSVRTGR